MTIPGFTSTGSKRPDALFGTKSGVPSRFVRSEGCRVWDDEGRDYLDLVMALGAVALGYAHPKVNSAVDQALRSGVVGPLPHVLEQELAERVCGVIPGTESVRFLKTGAEAVAAAVRIARTHTGREKVITCGYHGWLDWCQSEKGVPAAELGLRKEVPFNDLAVLKNAFMEAQPVAAVVLEPVIEEEPNTEWLTLARELASRSDAILIFDEIKTAFRIALGGAAERYGVVPDLSVIGKAFGNGFPIAAVSGSRDLMEAANQTWVSSTLATEHVSLAAALAVLDVYVREDVIGALRSRGEQLFAGLHNIAQLINFTSVSAKGIPEMCFLDFSDQDASAAFASMAASGGVIFKRNAYNFVSLAHTEEIVSEILEKLGSAAVEVERTCS